MRYLLVATYRGVPYQAGLGPDSTEATLFSPAPPPEELGFTAAAGYWRKQVSIADLDALWQSRPVGDYRGEPCLVLDDLGDRLHIAYLGRDAARAAQLGYWEIDREVFEVVVARYDVTNLTEERVDFSLTAAMFPSSSTEPPSDESAPALQAHGGTSAAVAEQAESWPPKGAATGQAGAGPGGYGGAAGSDGADRAARMPDRVTAWHGSPALEAWPGPEREGWPEHEARPESKTAAPPGRRTGHKCRISPESIFAELLTLSAIPQASYAVDEEIPGAMCLVKADGGFEVFSRTEDARLEVRFFEDEEAAYFYLFGVLAAEAVRSGRLRPSWPGGANGHNNSSGAPGTSSAATQNVSKYLRDRNFANSPSHPARVCLAGGADGPPLPKQPRRPLEAQVRKSIVRITKRLFCHYWAIIM
jgi:hypothetical protein